jgi:serine/arginine repetitive matrix protein 2
VLNQPDSLDSLATLAHEDLEIVDFSDFGKFAGVVEPPDPSASVLSTSRRPVTSDFFDDVAASKSEIGPWRRSNSTELADDHKNQGERASSDNGHSRDNSEAKVPDQPEMSQHSVMSSASSNNDATENSTAPATQQRAPRAPTFYREAAMSALDDVMSRIKGALDGMQAGETLKEGQHHLSAASHSLPQKPSFTSTPVKTSSANDPRWVPPPLRVIRPFEFDVQALEVFDVTGSAPPYSPRPVWNTFTVRLPGVSTPLEPLTKKQLNLSRGAPIQVRMDILSFDPPVQEMRREFSVNDIFPQLRRPSPSYKGKYKYRVLLPRTKFLNGQANAVAHGTLGPKVHLPANIAPSKPLVSAAFGRTTVPDSLSTWRKAPPPAKSEGSEPRITDLELNTVSRSPPPDLPSSNSIGVTGIPKSDLPLKTDGASIPRSRSQPKMPPGSAVAFYRNSRVDAVNANPQALVNFIVSSELEDPPETLLNGASSKPLLLNSDEPGSVEGSDRKTINSTTCELKSQPPSPEFVVPPLAQSKADSSDDSVSSYPFVTAQLT